MPESLGPSSARLLLAIALGAAPLPAACKQADPADGVPAVAVHGEAFAAFWLRFRALLLSSDWVAIGRMSADRLRLPAELEGEPATSVGREALATLLPKVLDQDSQTGTGAIVTNRMFLQQQKADKRFGPGVAIGERGARIGPFAFERRAGGWMLTEVVVQSDET